MTEPGQLAPPKVPIPLAPLPASPAKGLERLRTVLVLFSLLVLFALPALAPNNTFLLSQFAKWLALAILALSVDLLWGYTGLLSLGQGVYFGLGAYSIAYSLTLQKAAADHGVLPGEAPPSFMEYGGLAPNDPDYVMPPALAWIAPLGNIWLALAVAVLLPMLVAAFFGLVTFRLRIRGVYFALITQALLLALFILVGSLLPITGGDVGIKHLADFQVFGQTFKPYKKYVHQLFYLTAAVLLLCTLLCAVLVRTKFGKLLTAIRDNENRVLALGYNTAMYKTFVFALAGALGGISGALYVVANALAGPEYLSITFSITAVLWVAVGGRGTLLGAILGAILLGWANVEVSSAFPKYWTIVLGAMFILVVIYLPKGLIGAAGRAAVLGAVLGVVFADPFVKLLGPVPAAFTRGLEQVFPDYALKKEQIQVILKGLFIGLMVFLPRGLEYAGAKLSVRLKPIFLGRQTT